jgi:hypothetical protein
LSILQNSQDVRLDIAAGFYAISYQYEGKDVIVYRGSDASRPLDVLLGYPTALGEPIWVQSSTSCPFPWASG